MGFFQFQIIKNIIVKLSQSVTHNSFKKHYSRTNYYYSQHFPLHLNTYFMGPLLLSIYHSYSAGIWFKYQNLTSIDVRLWLLKSIPAR